MFRTSFRPCARVCYLLACCLAFGAFSSSAATKMKLAGYLTARADASVLMILDDRLELTSASKIVGKDDSGEHPLQVAELVLGMLVEAEGQWLDRHRFFAEKLTVDLRQNDKKVRGTAYLQEEPQDASKIASGDASELKVDGYWLTLDAATKRAWNVAKASSGLPQ